MPPAGGIALARPYINFILTAHKIRNKTNPKNPKNPKKNPKNTKNPNNRY
jgi:hypothetical protein